MRYHRNAYSVWHSILAIQWSNASALERADKNGTSAPARARLNVEYLVGTRRRLLASQLGVFVISKEIIIPIETLQELSA